MTKDVVLTGALLALAMVLFARALMAARMTVEVPTHPLGFMPPGTY